MAALLKNSLSLPESDPIDDRWWEAHMRHASVLATTDGNLPIDGTEGDDDLVGTVDDDTINGLGGDDFLDGGAGSDSLHGGDGSDWLTGGRNNEGDRDFLDGGAGDDTLIVGYGSLYGGAGDDTLISGQTALTGGYLPRGNHGADLSGGDGNDLLIGTAVDDELDGGIGNDTLLGGAGYDFLEGGAGADVLDGGAGDRDRTTYENSQSGIQIDLKNGTGHGGEAEGDTLRNIERVIGTNFNDLLIGSDTGVVLDGEGGNDIVHGGAGDDGLYGGFGDDVLEGGAGDDKFNPYLGSDWIDGGSGSDTITFEGFYTFPGDETQHSAGVRVDLGAGTILRGDFLEDTFTNIENINATSYVDTLIGNASDNTFRGGEGGDYINGGAGVDTVEYSGDSYNERGVGVNLNSGLTQGADATGDVLVGIENVVGSPFDGDGLVGNDGVNHLSGKTGRDSLSGLAGDDILEDPDGGDQLYGGEGADSFVFAYSWKDVSTIRDFDSAGGDKIDLSSFYGDYANDEPLDLTFVGYNNLTGKAGEVGLVAEPGMTRVIIDENGDGSSDFELWVDNFATPALNAGDFIL